MKFPLCRNCIYYEPVLKKRHGFCRSDKAYYYNKKVCGGHTGPNRCYTPKEEVDDGIKGRNPQS